MWCNALNLQGTSTPILMSYHMITLSLSGTVPDQFLFNDLLPPKFTFEGNGFTVTPTSFALKTGDEVVIDVEFRPTEVC